MFFTSQFRQKQSRSALSSCSAIRLVSCLLHVAVNLAAVDYRFFASVQLAGQQDTVRGRSAVSSALSLASS